MHDEPVRGVSTERKAAYYVGMALTLVGLALFVSIFFSATRSDPGAGMSSFTGRVFGGMGLMAVGQWIRAAGARGLAGSGVLLDPERARRELEPYSRMAGGMLGDALEEAQVELAQPSAVMIRCRACKRLNEEDSKFCQECGAEL